MNWKISRIEISSFKAFKHIRLDVDSTSLLTLDGPNGFGKTSIFDAIELLLTGRIARIERLFDKLIPGQQLNYEDNLYWNTRSLRSDLCIKIEFSNEQSSFILARKACSNILQDKRNNKANNFSYFLLYKLDDFESKDYTAENICPESFIEEKFGENIKENYSLLNYLEQGQNEYLFSSGLNQRKDQLESLINTKAINTEIEKCKLVERKLTKFINQPDRLEKEKRLEEEYKTLCNMLDINHNNIQYKRISTTDSLPAWDKRELPIIYSTEVYAGYLNKVQLLLDLFPLKEAIQFRTYNDKIESFLTREMDLLRAIAQLGKNTKQLDIFDEKKRVINSLNSARSILQKGARTLTYSEVSNIPFWNIEKINEIEEKIKERDRVLQSSGEKSALFSEIFELKKQLLHNHFILSSNDTCCPLCGVDWDSQQRLSSALETRTKNISDSLDSESNLLIINLSSITKDINHLLEELNDSYITANHGYNSNLHQTLIQYKERIGQIEDLAKSLEEKNILYSEDFTNNEEETAIRLEALIASIRARKREEVYSLPENWESTIESVFKKTEDFYIIEKNDLEMKFEYISLKESESKNNTLTRINDDLMKHRQESQAATTAKENVTKLKDSLIKVEKSYADQTISEIELIFHIYSGRLIQNYQRGLGLFIESKEGKQLRFTTAEKSEHDSILSMSSGQISAISLAFFFSLNKVYAKTSIILIDDPSQSLDEINIASLTDLLRCELRDRQLIVSSHEEDISTYMRYRFSRAGLSSKTINMQNIKREELT